MDHPPPVEEICPHKKFDPSPMQDPLWRLDDSDKSIYYHKYYEAEGNLLICGKPERWRWNQYLRYCGECNRLFSNPWVPICGRCWVTIYEDLGTFPSWRNVIRWDIRL